MKVFALNVLKKPTNTILRSPLKKAVNIKTKLPIVKTPLVSYLIQREDEFMNQIASKLENNQYVISENKITFDIINELESKRIILPEKPWDPPRFVSGALTDSAYNEIVGKISSSRLLTDYQKQQYIQKLATNNYKSLSFKGSEDMVENSILENPEQDLTSPFESVDTANSDIFNSDFSKDLISGMEDILPDLTDDSDTILGGISDLFDSLIS